MTDSEQREAARQFANKWKSGGDEMKDSHKFWLELLHDVLGIDKVTDYIDFEKSVKLPEGDGKIHTRRIDGYIPAVRVLIEQKGSTHPLDEKEPQSGGEMLTPYEQGKRYNDNLPFDEKARWIVTCNFLELWIYDMNATVPEPQKVSVVDLQTKYPLLDFLVKREVKELSHEMEVSIKAGDIVGLIYDAFLKQYGIPETAPKGETAEEREKREHKLKSLNALCVRLVFLFYAEDAGIFERNQFHDYLEHYPAQDCRNALMRLFRVLDQKPEERDEYLEQNLAAFPYVNGGLFSDENIIIPPITDEIKDLLLKKASEGFDWRDISPTIFGAVFESTLNPETRRAGGMHYTSIANIHKVIDPLFLDDLKAEFEDIKKITVPRTKKQKLQKFQQKLASLTFFDPAAGSGNFLTLGFTELRKLENQVIAELTGGQISFGMEDYNPIQVSIQQFYGIEINDFAVTVAKTALWIAENQMLEETKSILYGFKQDFLPLKTYVNITEGNALRLDWEKIVPKEKLSYIMGNPPFVGFTFMTRTQKEDIDALYPGVKNIDYVAGWFKKADQFIEGTNIQCGFVSTNTITQGETVARMWEDLHVTINFAYRTFVWSSEANDQAHVHCVIIGFAKFPRDRKVIYEDGQARVVNNINAYLADAPGILVKSKQKPFGNVPRMVYGNKPADGGALIIEDKDLEDFLKRDPDSKKYIHPLLGATEFLHNKKRWCLWLVGANPSDLKKCPMVMQRIDECRKSRQNSIAVGIRKFAATPTLFAQVTQPEGEDYIIVPRHSSQKRRYVPMGFVSAEIKVNDAVQIIPNATVYLFGLLESNVHMAWMRAICGRIKSDYRYSRDIVYNNFPWPTPTEEQENRITATAQGILDARALYPDSSLADLYDPLTMPPELRKAHTTNDVAVMKAYGFKTSMSESDCVGELMRMYQELVEKTSTKK